jgi:hypothetical protein
MALYIERFEPPDPPPRLPARGTVRVTVKKTDDSQDWDYTAILKIVHNDGRKWSGTDCRFDDPAGPHATFVVAPWTGWVYLLLAPVRFLRRLTRLLRPLLGFPKASDTVTITVTTLQNGLEQIWYPESAPLPVQS